MTAYTDIEIAAVAWAADAEFRALHGDPDPSLPGDNGDEEAHAVTLAGVRAILEGATPGQLHEAWRGAREAKGWTCGPRLDSLAKTHPSLVPWADLPERRRVQGAVFAAVVREMAGQDAPELAAEGTPPDVRPRADGRHGLDITCGKCGEDYGTNVTDADEIECPECEARRCPHCRTWYGGSKW